MPLSNFNDIAHARALIAYGSAVGRACVIATITQLPSGSYSNINRNYTAYGLPRWSWEVSSFINFTDVSIEIWDGWPGWVEENPGAWPSGATIGFWNYTVVAEIGTDPNLWNCDLNIDGNINFSDFAMLASYWAQPVLRDIDIDNNGQIDIYDMAALADNWLSSFYHPGWVCSHWKFDEGSGTIAHDSNGRIDGTIYGATWTTGKINGALSFDGTNDYVNCKNGPSNFNNLTVSAWIKTSTKGVLVSDRYKSYGNGNWYTLFSNGIELGDSNQCLNFNADTLDNIWHHIVYIKNGINHTIYVDGSVDQSFVSNVTINQDQPTFFGKRWYQSSDAFWFNGIIDDIYIYNRALSNDEVQMLYQQGLNP